MGGVVFSSNVLARASTKWVNLFFLLLFSPHTLQMFSGNMYIKQVALSKSNLEAVLMAVAISKGQMPRNNNIFHSYTLNLSYNLMCEMLLGWLTEMLAEIQ